MAEIVLMTFNARYRHASLGLRCILANLGPLREQTRMLEFNLEHRPEEVIETILACQPRIVGCGVYIWNTDLVTRTAGLLKQLRPDIKLILGGPEVGHALDDRPLFELADHLIAGEGEEVFSTLCQEILAGTHHHHLKKIMAPPPELHGLQLPYDDYNATDLAQRQLYVESSRGCPYRCAFCLSARDAKVRRFALPPFLANLQSLLERGGRHFKFVDRTFNLDDAHAVTILDFFIKNHLDGLFVHFEMIPDRLSEEIKQRLAAFPAGTLQLEIGIQSFNPEVLRAIHRHQDTDKATENLSWLLDATQAHIHTDLIVGLPKETPASFAAGFDRLIAIAPHEIQVGILKRLAGTPLTTMTDAEGMIFSSEPPYELLASQRIDFFTMRRYKRFARYWDLVGNSGRFPRTLALVFKNRSPFAVFMTFCDWLFATTHQTHNIALPRLSRLVLEGFSSMEEMDPSALGAAMALDMQTISHTRHDLSGAPPPRQARRLIMKTI
ncbi:MAG: B12-binding domain-containing radical SAM protein [Magnetococcus sp. YQC-5]